ncbi:MAG: hypothetical protein NTW67_00910 [Candidatus Woesearchaeota archaeon]|nr:hypothetical protein [Candidatus Woesearchaeota archaeon]
MKILNLLILGLVLAMSASAIDFPGPFAGVARIAIVVGDNAPAEDVISAVDVANAFGPSIAIQNTKLASEVDDITKYNSVLIGSPCYHPIMNQLVGYPENCQMGGMKLIRHSNGNIALLIMGATPAEIRQNVRSWVSTREQPPAVSKNELCSKVSLKQTVKVASGIVYEVGLVYVDGNNAKFSVNGEVTDLMGVGARTQLADSSYLSVKSISGNTAEFCIKPAKVQTPPAETYETCMSKVQIMKDRIMELEDADQPASQSRYAEYESAFLRCKNLLPQVPETYDSCVSEYENRAREYQFSQNIPEAQRIRIEGLRACGEKFGRPVPPVKVETGFDRCIKEGYQRIYALPEDQQGSAKQNLLNKCEPLRQPAPEESTEYKKCMQQLNVLKQELVDKYTSNNVPIPADVMKDYEARSDRCLLLAGWTSPGSTVVPVPAVEPLPVETSCVGCKRDRMCLQFGIRLVDENGKPVYCDFDSFFKPQKQLGESCQNNYECMSNTCSEKCISVTERIEAVERELKEQRTLIEKILDFFKGLF